MNKIYRTIAIVFFSVMLCRYTHAQPTKKPSSLYEGKLALNGTISLDSLTRYVHKHTGIRFSFNSGKVKGNKEIFFPKGQYNFQQLLELIKKTTSLYYAFFNGYIIFQDNPPKEQLVFPSPNKNSKPPALPKKAINKKNSTSTKGAVVPNVPIPDSAGNKKEPLKTVLDTAITVPYAAAAIIIDSSKTSVTATPDSSTTKPSIAAPIQPKSKSIAIPSDPDENTTESKWYSQIGFYATESLYSNIAFAIGSKPIHLLLSAGTNYTVTHVGIGVGSIIKDNEQSQWALNAGIGFMQRKIGLDTSSVTLKGQLYTVNVSWNMKLNEKWIIKLSPSFNLLKTAYYRNGQPVIPAKFPSSVSNAEYDKGLLKPPFLLKNGFDPLQSSDTKTWVGLSLGIYYQIF